MNEQESNKVSKKEVLKALTVAFLIVFIGELFLVWQYQRLEKERLPLIEERLKQQEEEMEERLAQNVLDKFITARIEKNESRATLYLTERAMEQKLRDEFTLINNFQIYEILKTEKLEAYQYRFMIKISEGNGISFIIEAIILTKILNQYYIDSVGIAG